MRAPAKILLALLAVALACTGPLFASVDEGVIRLGGARGDTGSEPSPDDDGPSPSQPEEVRVEEPRTGFDYNSFESRLESLWFQRKTLLANGRVEDADAQLEKLRAVCAEEGVLRLENVAGALVAEAHRYLEEGNYDRARSALYFAEAFDPLRSQTHLGRAALHWQSNRRVLAAAGEILAALKASIANSLQDLAILHEMAFHLGLALALAAVVFSLLMLLRHQIPLRHEVEELFAAGGQGGWPAVAGWALLGLPFLIWVGAGWAVAFWLLVTFRYMTRGERMTSAVIFGALFLAVPFYSIAVGLYGTTADPAVRTTLASVDGEYAPDRIVKLRQLVDAHPEEASYRFLLGGLYKNGRYFDEAFQQYRKSLDLNPTLAAAYINIGNIFYATGQYPEAIANYRRALELEPESMLAYFNMHLAQSEDFRFKAAEESLGRARMIDSSRVSRLLSGAGGWGDRPAVRDATLEIGSIWEAALEGRNDLEHGGDAPLQASWAAGFAHPIGIVAVVMLIGCGAWGWSGRVNTPARRCVRCGRAFCHLCKSSREAQEYCTQCLHLYVLGDGLAPGTKSRKLYEVERYARRRKRVRRLASTLFPGAGHVLRGRTGRGFAIIALWFFALVAVQPAALARTLAPLGMRLTPDLLTGASSVPVPFNGHTLGLLAVLALPVIWIAGNVWRWKRET